MRRASSAFLELQTAGYTFAGDLYWVLEGFRVYPGQAEPIPQFIRGSCQPFSWNGQTTVSGGLSAGVQKVASVQMKGLDTSQYILRRAAVISSGTVAAVSGAALQPEDVILLQVYDTYQQNKLWARLTSPPGVSAPGQFMPAKCLVDAGGGGDWPWPRYVNGQDTITVDIYTDPSAWTGSAPGTIEVQLNGDRVYA
jgi:hypothetical protein